MDSINSLLREGVADQMLFSSQQNNASQQQSSSKKETMLKKLLEQQETYIVELERKNRELKETSVMGSSHGSKGLSGTMGSNINTPGGGILPITLDLEAMKRPNMSSLDKLQTLIDQLLQNQPGLNNTHPLMQALLGVRSQIHTEVQVMREDLTQRERAYERTKDQNMREIEGLRDELQQTEESLQGRITELNEEVSRLSNVEMKLVQQEKLIEEKRVLEEALDQINIKYRRETDDLRRENQSLKIKASKIQTIVEELTSEQQQLKLRHDKALFEKDAQHGREKKLLQQLFYNSINHGHMGQHREAYHFDIRSRLLLTTLGWQAIKPWPRVVFMSPFEALHTRVSPLDNYSILPSGSRSQQLLSKSLFFIGAGLYQGHTRV